LFASKGFDENYLKMVMDNVDTDKDGDITLEEFKRLMFDLLG